MEEKEERKRRRWWKKRRKWRRRKADYSKTKQTKAGVESSSGNTGFICVPVQLLKVLPNSELSKRLTQG